MNQQQYMALIERLEQAARTHPARFRARVVLAGLAVYGVEACILLVLAAGAAILLRWAVVPLVVGDVARTMLGAALGAVVALLLKWLAWPRVPAPQGRLLTRAEAPGLFDALDRMRVRLNGPAIDRVLVDARYTAAITQRPALGGLWGPRSNTLMLGLPYLLGVPTREMLATIAHEYGHLRTGDAPLHAWVYRQRRIVGTLHEQIQDRAASGGARRMFAALLERVLPYYNACTFVLARQNEYEADRVATGLVGAAANAQGLVRDALQMRWMYETFWPTLLRHADRAVRPPFMPYAAMRTAFRAGHGQWSRPERLEAALAQRSGPHDTHPCLRERLAAIGVAASLPQPVERTAADVLLGAATTRRLIAEFDAQWWRRESRRWEERYRQSRQSRQRLQALRACDVTTLPPAQLEELALLTTEFDTPQAARPVLERLLAQPGGPHAQAAFHYGRLLLDADDVQGLRYLQVAAGTDRALAQPAAMQGHQFLLRTQDEQAARRWMELVLPAAS